MRIAWAQPYARKYEVQYWDGAGDAMDYQDKGVWKNFDSGSVADGKGGTATVQLSAAPISARFVRIFDGIVQHLRLAWQR